MRKVAIVSMMFACAAVAAAQAGKSTWDGVYTEEQAKRGGEVFDRECAGCHGPAGAGMPSQYPRVAGQFSEYVEAQLKAFRIGAGDPQNAGARVNDPNGMMRSVAARMTDKEIRAVAEYVAGLR